jgi:hypothetical protein
MSESDIRWVQFDSWHLIERTYISRGSRWFVTTRCGLEREWDQTFLDRLPGGSEKSCENCLKYKVGDIDEPAPKKARKKK